MYIDDYRFPVALPEIFEKLSSGMEIEELGKAIDKFLKPIVAKYKLSPVPMGSFPGFILEK